MKSHRINKFFERYSAFLLKWRWAAITLFVVVLLVSFYGMSKMVQQTSFDDYFIEGDPMLVKTEEFKAHFGNDYFVGILTDCDDHFTKENLTLLRELGNELLDSLSYADKVTSLVDLEFMLGTEDGMEIVQIVPDEIPETGSKEMAKVKALAYSKPHVARKLISADGKKAWTLLKLRAFPAEEEWKKTGNVAPDIITGQEVTRIITKEKCASLHPLATGMPYVTQQKTEYIGQEMGRLVMLAVIICILVMLVMTRSLRGVVCPLLSVLGGVFMTFGIAGYTQMYVDSTVVMIPAILAFAVAIAYNIHIFSYFNHLMRQHGKRKEAVLETMSEVGWSVVFCGLTTFVSLLSFLIIPIRPMKCVGIICSLTILFVLLTTLIMTPVLISFGRDRKPKPGVDGEGGTRLSHWMEKLNDFTFRHSKPIVAIFTVVCVALAIGLWKIEPAFDIERTMGIDVPYVKDVLTVGRSELGSLYSYDLVMEFENEDDAKQPENLKKLERLEALVSTYPLTKRTNSILDILKDLNQTLNGGETGSFRIPVGALRVRYIHGSWNLEAVAVPVAEFFKFPTDPANPWSVGPLPPEVKPDRIPKNMEFGTRFSCFLGGVDFSLMALRTWSKMPELQEDHIGYHRLTVVGGVFNRLSADWAATDQIHAILGYDFFYADKGMFVRYAHNSEVWVKLKYCF